MSELKTFIVPFTKRVSGYWTVKARNEQEAIDNFMNGDEFDNDSDYDIDEDGVKEE